MSGGWIQPASSCDAMEACSASTESRTPRRISVASLAAYVDEESKKKIEKLSLADDDHTGLEILHLFVLDLLGRETNAARIFESKTAEDFKHKQVVTRKAKALAWFGLFVVNLFFVYYSMLKGYVKGENCQRQYSWQCLVQGIIEVLLFQTMECAWVNFFVPDMASVEVTEVAALLKETVSTLCVKDNAETQCLLQAPEYLFVSTRVAAAYPDLLESIVIRAYESYLPGQLSRKWNFGPVARISRGSFTSRYSMIAMLFAALQAFGASPFALQRVIIRLVQPWVLTGFTLLIYYTTKSAIGITIECLIVALIVGLVYRRHRSYAAKENAKLVVQPHGDDSDSDVDDPHNADENEGNEDEDEEVDHLADAAADDDDDNDGYSSGDDFNERNRSSPHFYRGEKAAVGNEYVLQPESVLCRRGNGHSESSHAVKHHSRYLPCCDD